MPHTSPRESFDRSLHKLLDQVLVLGSMVEQAVQSSLDALIRRDLNTAQQVYDSDQRINEKRYQLETDTITIIATQQPMARDVRLLAAILEIITELERIGDYAKGINKINLLLDDESIAQAILADLQRMTDLGLGMLRRSLDAFITQDVEAARQIPQEDDLVDQLYNHIYRSLMDEMNRTPAMIDRANHMMWAAHNLERMADRVTNICERIVYVATGEMKELDSSDDEQKGNWP
jgi:phosphate transport system protein